MKNEVVVIPSSPAQIDAVAARCRSLVRRNALLAAGVAMVPVPGLDWVTDIGVLEAIDHVIKGGELIR